MPALIGARRQALTLNKGVPIWDFRNGMPAGSTYTRTGASTGLTLAGLIQSFAADAPQRTDRGVAIEPAATNLFLRSQELNNASWTKSDGTVTANAGTGPDGTSSADVFIPNTSNVVHFIGQTVTLPASTNVTTIAAKASGYRYIQMIDSNSGSNFANFDLQDGVVGSLSGYTASISQLNNGWWRIFRTDVVGAASRALRFAVVPSLTSGRAAAFAGNGTSGILLDFAQTETSPSTSPVITTTASATRGLPVFTEPVPSGRTRALLTYADASTTLVTGLTPGGTFDAATAVIGASKGRFGASELITREWQA